jgi:geranylgeranyl diphosphate synthase type II
MMTPALSVTELSSIIDRKIKQLPLPDHPDRLYEPIRYFLSLGGKRLRPLLALMNYNLFSDEIDKAVLPALSLEVFHNFTLVHDDIMDKAPMRRGKETVHKKWDNNVAILSGDAMLVKAYQLLAQAPQENLPRLLKAFNKTAMEVCEGQQKDMDFENYKLDNDIVSEAEYMDMIRLKTAVLFGLSFQFGGILGAQDESIIAQLYNAGVQLGLAFQLQDDLLDLYGGENFGKQLGGDILNAKKTFLLVKALELANEDDGKEIIDIIGNDGMPDKDKIAAIQELYDRYQIKELTQSKIEMYLKDFKKSITIINSSRTTHLLDLVDSMANRLV